VAGRQISAVLLLLGGLLAAAPAAVGQGTLPGESSHDVPSASHDYSSIVYAVTPHVPGVTVRVQGFADRLLLSNRTEQTVTIYGYQGEPYARVLPDGTAEENTRSPATYINTTFYGDVTVPASANAQAPPRWVPVGRTGTFEWLDHRIHWASPLLPPEVKDRARRTFVFGWSVPISIGSRGGAIVGALYWNAQGSPAPLAAIVLVVAIGIGGALLILLMRRRRARVYAAGATGGEAW